MVHIAAGIPLLTVTDGTEILGVIEKCKADTFLLTSNRSITIFKPQDPKPLQSWVNKPSSRFTCPAVYIQETDEFVAVVNDKQIYKWSSENATPFTQKPKTLKSAVSRILIQERGNPLLLMSNGSVRLLDDAVGGSRAVEKGFLEEGEEIRDAWIWRKGADENITSYIICLVQNSLTKKKSILLLPVQPGEKQHDKSGDDVMRLQLDDPINKACPLESATLFTDETTAVLHTLWDGGRLCSTSITESDLRRYKDSPTLSCHHRCTINGSTGKVRIAAIDDTHVAVAGMQSKTTKDKLEASLCIWETGFGTLQIHHALGLEDGDGDGTPLFLGEVNGHLLLATRRTVMLHRYECSDGTLAAALGRLAGPGPGLHQDLPILGLDWTSSLLEESPIKPKGRKSTAGTKTQTQSKDSDGQTSLLLNSILDESNTQTSKVFSGLVEKYMKACRGDQPDSTALMLILKHVVKRVETNPKFWCPETLHHVITTKAVAASSCPEFIAMLARKQEVSLLLDCLQCMRDVPELILMQCLQVFLSIDEDKLPSSRQTTETEHSDVHEVMSPVRRTYVDEVLCKPFTDAFLLDAVKHLPFKEVTSLLRYLHFLLTASSPGGDDSSSLVSMDNVVDWIGAMLDAHFAQLVLLPEARPLLTHLQNAVKDQVQFSSELNVVRNLLHHTHGARSHIKATPSNAAKSYSIEVLKM
ncbi:nucleolar protein 11-like isoform X2 [Strongylocentrotus purpuratus]|uniref:Nucleolar protein 11 n=1 Tax=Strongylocentrotus purpuratus TaxID=7668 RepID=A0A7M7NPS2_STRPU|nr:nucleolar protein 11-like isoform X2 [Strongylocentrotus purpuratus]